MSLFFPPSIPIIMPAVVRDKGGQPAKDIDVYHEKCTTILLKVKTSLPKTRKRRLVSDGVKDFK